MNKESVKKLFQNKNKLYVYVILIIGVIFMITAGGGEKSKKTEENISTSQMNIQKELENILSDIKGAGTVSVMISYDTTSEKEIAYETKSNTSKKDNGGTITSEESSDRNAVMTDGAPTIIREKYPAVRGVIVTADGADDPVIKKAISDSVTAVLDVPPHKVCVYSKK